MNRLGITFICVIFILGAYSQAPTTWYRDWQNAPNSRCSPDSFTVSNNSNHFSIAYNFSLLSLKYCPSNISGNYTAGLSVNSSTGNWVDSNGQQLVYDSTNDIIQFVFSSNSTPAPTPYLYDKNGAALPQEQTLGYLGGTWISPNPLGSASLQDCCVPDSLFISPADQIFNRGIIFVLPSFTSNCSTVNTTLSARIKVPNLELANWTGIGYGDYNSSNYVFNLSNTSQLTFTLANGSDVCGSYSYEKAPGVKLLNNTWYLDWQSQVMSVLYPTTYQVSSVNDSYMVTTMDYSDDLTRTSFLVENLQGQYYDNILGLGFTYNDSTKTLFSIYSSTVPLNLLYSLNGSYINNPLSESYWNNPQSIDNSSTAADCCVPDWAYISSFRAGFQIEYYLPSDYLSIPGCADWTTFVINGTLSTGLAVAGPSTSNVSWWDGFNSQIYFANMSNLSVITIKDFLGYGNCSFNLAVTSQKPPLPSPLSSVWMSIEISMFVIMGIVMLLASI